MKTTVKIVDGEIEIILHPETVLEKQLIASCKKQGWDSKVQFFSANPGSYYDKTKDEIVITICEPPKEQYEPPLAC